MSQSQAIQVETLPAHTAPSQAIVAVVTPAQMLSLAVEQGADLDKLEKLMDLQERWEAKEAEKAFNAAMSEFRRNCPSIYKTASGQSNKFAPLSGAAEVIREPLAQCGLSYRWEPTQNNGLMRVTCLVTHLGGHTARTTLESALDNSGNKNGVQAIGSTVAYLERYTLFAALGLSSKDMDDDGAQAAANQQRPALPSYQQDKFNVNWPDWNDLVNNGKKTPAQIATSLKTRFTLTDEQEAQLLELGDS